MKIRHSSLPKLALCGQYEGTAGNSSAASRGTMLDGVFRDAWVSGELPRELNDEDTAAVRWALAQCIQLGGGADGLETADAKCKIQTSGLHQSTSTTTTFTCSTMILWRRMAESTTFAS